MMIAVILETSFMHPPFGIDLYNLRSVAPPSVGTSQIYVGAIPFLALQLLMVAILIAFPGLASTPTQDSRLSDRKVEELLRPPSDLAPAPLDPSLPPEKKE